MRETSRQNNRNRDSLSKELKELQIAAKEANKLLGAKNLNFLDFPDNRLDSIDRLDLIKAIEINIKKYKPTTIYTHYAWDLNIDHRRLHEAVITASRPIPGQIVKRYYALKSQVVLNGKPLDISFFYSKLFRRYY